MNDLDLARARLYRARFFSHPEAYGKKHESQKDGKLHVEYYPVCQNFWSDGCGIKLKTHSCGGCTIKKYEPVSEETLHRHLSGREVQNFYLVLKDGTVRFAAMDFDLKPGREAEGYPFDLVKKAYDVLAGWGIPSVIARSSTMGHHIYVFIDGFYPGYKIRAILDEVNERLFGEEHRLGLRRKLPEFFPKQDLPGPEGLGNAITPPLNKKGLERERNCFVDPEGQAIGAGGSLEAFINAQWAYLEAVPLISPDTLDEVIAREGIRCREPVRPASSRGGTLDSSGREMDQRGWHPPTTGSIEKVLEGCKAFRALKERCEKGEVLRHDEGFALFHVCMSTLDGLEWFKKNVPGWGQSEKDLKQLEHSLDKGYSPWTCTKMQDKGICKRGTVCFQKQPPREVVEGRLVVLHDAPPSTWPDPSPIRYAHGQGEDFMQKLIEEADSARAIEDPRERVSKVKDIVARAQVFDSDQQDELKIHLKTLTDDGGESVVKARELNKIFTAAELQKAQEIKRALESDPRSVKINGNLYIKVEPYGYVIPEVKKNTPVETQISNVDIWIDGVKSYVDDEQETRKVFVGHCRGAGFEIPFEVDTSVWFDNGDFFCFFGKIMGKNFNVLREHVDKLRQAVMAFSDKRGIETIQIITTQGWYKDTYLMPSVLVDKDGVRPNTQQRVELQHKDLAKYLDFKLLTEDELKDTLIHIKAEFLNTWPRKWTTLGLAHALLPALVKPLNIIKKPTFFYEGETGTGKTELTHFLQYFWGSFDRILNMTSTGKGMAVTAYEFKDALLVLDDFKGISPRQIEDVKNVIQYSYDGNLGAKLARDSSLKPSKGSRAVIMASGEQFITGEASVVARTMLVEVDRQDTRETERYYARCTDMRENYCGITPRFLHWLLNQDKQLILARMNDEQCRLRGALDNRQNAPRIAYNLAQNFISWALFVDFLQYHEVITQMEKDSMLTEHRGYLVDLAKNTTELCEDEETGTTFIRYLKQMLEAGEVSIRGLEGYDIERKTVIGYIPPHSERGTHLVHLYPDILWAAVANFVHKSTPVRGTQRSVWKQLYTKEILICSEPGRYKTLVRDGERRGRVLVMDMAKLGIGARTMTPKLRVVNSDGDDDRY